MISLPDYINSQMSHEEIEARILALVGPKTEVEKEPLVQIGGRPMRPDLVFPNGAEIFDISTRLIIEIKGVLGITIFKQEIEKARLYLQESVANEYWVVYQSSRLDLPKSPEKNIKFFSISDLEEKFGKRANDIQNDGVLRSGLSDIGKSQESIIDAAAQALTENHCSFILGAGVSVDAGSPNWDDLLKQLLAKSDKHKPIGAADYNNVCSKCSWSTLITARYILDPQSDEKALIQDMRSIFYTRGKCDYNPPKTSLPIIADIVKAYNVESAITFNYDEFLEEALDDKGVRNLPIYDKGTVTKEQFPVYHVHGLISREEGGASCPPVLSERRYHLLYSDPYHWSNVETLRALTRNTCFLVGLSMSDPNLRRLLDISKTGDSEEARHYIFMRREPLGNAPDKGKDEKHWSNIERQFRQLGLNIIWFDYNSKNDFTGLADKLQEISDKAKSLTIE